ncbi:MAG: rhodanese-like domain-containing protein [Phototrophicaceae bacterium]
MNYQNLTIVQYDSQFFAGRLEHALIDVRTRSEYAGGHIPGALNLPLDELQNRLQDIPRNRPIVVVCASGSRSRTGCDILATAGFDKPFNLEGGTSSWMMGMRPIER